MPLAEADVALETDLIDVLFWAGRGGEAVACADSLAERASAVGNRLGELCGSIQGALFRSFLEPEGATEKLDALLQQSLPVFEAARDDHALYIGYSSLGQVANMRGQMDGMLQAYERAAAHARQTGLPNQFVAWRRSARLYGTTPVSELLTWLDERDAREGQNFWLRAHRAVALAMQGRFDEARAILAEARAQAAERGAAMHLAGINMVSVDVELLAGDPAAAVELGEAGSGVSEEQGERSMLSTAAGGLAQALYAVDRLDDADIWAGRATELGASDDVFTQMLSRQVRGKVLARRGEHAEAELLAREALAACEKTDMLDAQGNVYADLAEVLSLARKPDEAADALEHALERYERKGNLVSAGRARARLAELKDAAQR